MAAGRFTWKGYEEFKTQLRNIPTDLHGEAAHIVEAHANRVALIVRQRYHRGATGNLIAGVDVVPIQGDALYTGFKVVSRAPHAHLYEEGTKVRANKHGDNRGRMPRFNVLGPVAAEQRFRMYAAIRAMQKRYGIRAK